MLSGRRIWVRFSRGEWIKEKIRAGLDSYWAARMYNRLQGKNFWNCRQLVGDKAPLGWNRQLASLRPDEFQMLRLQPTVISAGHARPKNLQCALLALYSSRSPTLSSFIRPTKSEVGAKGAELDALIELRALVEAVITRSHSQLW